MKKLGLATALMLGLVGLSADAQALQIACTFYEAADTDTNYVNGGRQLNLYMDVELTNLANIRYDASSASWNDRISGYKLYQDSTYWTSLMVYSAADYGGTRLKDRAFSADTTVGWIGSTWNDIISSIKCQVAKKTDPDGGP